ncbi:maleylpyruvate isomerase family mycothiol-dependent enzyme [Actinocatenispora rupis]|uniref:TIGR03083 family protein n=1 Tax=Actinocatenispora rupis TaxID=519421 RepID=A0A8J3J3B0_9ACTN|nr:maleylpyruvate isomerase family mycothiol-dependent enzyme [Actinocatenispora rupis]GID13845.1 hypothetical protein Aru02nite_47340 [Actinocatenispora rupis]
MTTPGGRGTHPELLYPDVASVPRAVGTAPPAPAPAGQLAALRAARDRIAGLARGDLAAAVPDCPGWTLGELVRHLGSVSHRVTDCLRTGRLPDGWATRPPGWVTVTDWYVEASRSLLTALSDRRPDDPAGTWWPPATTVAFWYRRMAHEFTVHRYDAEAAAAVPPDPVDDAFAIDGCDEVLERWLAYFGVAERLAGLGERVALRTEGAGWTVTLTPDGPAVERSLVDGPDATVTAAPADLYRWLWGRAAPVATDGDPRAVDALRLVLTATTA